MIKMTEEEQKSVLLDILSYVDKVCSEIILNIGFHMEHY